MHRNHAPSSLEAAELDRFYRAGGLRRMASPHVHYHDPECPHPGCAHKMEWIDFQLELYGEPKEIYEPLVRAWWEGAGFADRCPTCSGWIRFTTLGMEAIQSDTAEQLPHLPDNWHTVAQFA